MPLPKMSASRNRREQCTTSSGKSHADIDLCGIRTGVIDPCPFCALMCISNADHAPTYIYVLNQCAPAPVCHELYILRKGDVASASQWARNRRHSWVVPVRVLETSILNTVGVRVLSVRWSPPFVSRMSYRCLEEAQLLRI